MTRGKPYKDQQREDIIRILEPFLKLGCSVRKACDYAGVPNQTVDTWIQNDGVLRAKITAWQNEMSVLARKNWAKKLKDKDYVAAKDWLERKEKDEFATRTEQTGKDGKDLIPEESPESLAKAMAFEKWYKDHPQT